MRQIIGNPYLNLQKYVLVVLQVYWLRRVENVIELDGRGSDTKC